LQWALLQGVQAGDEGGEGQAEAAASADVAGTKAPEWDFHWDIRRDADELVELFRLSSLETLQQGRSLLSGDRGTVTVGEGEGEARLEVKISVSIEPFEHEEEVFDAARATMSIRRGGEEVSKPTVVTRLGERAIVTTGMWDRRGKERKEVLYIVIQVDPVEGPE